MTDPVADRERADRRRRVEEAQTKLKADFISRMGTTSVTLGVFVPTASLLFDQISIPILPLLVGGVSFAVIGFVLHMWAVALLETLP